MERLRISQRSDLIIFPVRLQPRASRDEIVGPSQGALKIRLTAPPVDNQANDRLLGFLAKTLRLSAPQVLLLSGHRSRNKTIGIKGLSRTELMANMAPYLASSVDSD